MLQRTASLRGSHVLCYWLNKLEGDSLTEILGATKAEVPGPGAGRHGVAPLRRSRVAWGALTARGSPGQGRAAGSASASGPCPTVTFGRGSLIPED